LERLQEIKEVEDRLQKIAKEWREEEISLVRTIPGFDWILASSVVVFYF